MKKITGLFFVSILIASAVNAQFGRLSPADSLRRDSINRMTQQDHVQMLKLLNIHSVLWDHFH